MARNVHHSDEPSDRLTRICEAMSDAMENHPERQDGDVAIITVDSMIERRGGMMLVGYADPRQALTRLLEHADALAKAHDIPLTIIQTDAIGGQG